MWLHMLRNWPGPNCVTKYDHVTYTMQEKCQPLNAAVINIWDCKSLPKTFITRHKNDIVSTWIPGCQKKDFIAWKWESSSTGFFKYGTTKTASQGILCVAVCCVHCRMFSGLPGLYLLAHPSHPQTVTTKNTSRHCQMSSKRQLPVNENGSSRKYISIKTLHGKTK